MYLESMLRLNGVWSELCARKFVNEATSSNCFNRVLIIRWVIVSFGDKMPDLCNQISNDFFMCGHSYLALSNMHSLLQRYDIEYMSFGYGYAWFLLHLTKFQASIRACELQRLSYVFRDLLRHVLDIPSDPDRFSALTTVKNAGALFADVLVHFTQDACLEINAHFRRVGRFYSSSVQTLTRDMFKCPAP